MSELLRIETEGSVWFLDQDRKTYRRTPRREGPREEPWRSESEGTALEDLTEHPYTTWQVYPPGSHWRNWEDQVVRYDKPVVVIRIDDAQIIAPMPLLEYLRLTGAVDA